MASSREKNRQPKIPTGSYPQEEVVNPRGTEEVPSFSPARTNEPTREAYGIDLMEQVVERGNLLSALHRVEKNKGAAGVDGMEIKSLRSFLMEYWVSLRNQLLQGTYQPSPVRRVEIPKPVGGVRLLSIPTANSYCTPPNKVLELES
jgi:RNA-directed DNA polymerase